ncbi:hypothetical protein HWQ46_25425 [Shewanella sp. D64]|uniref:DUF7415 domain-containing protein n=1 Tax=unclassified Shewanella TaxID=196818 RepID=UPI0022BA6B1B|nr:MULTISPECIES: hypothetical protein [unclassified Shewanella]MEC4728860.1 hypothetical protein [Shewanella sp. D64]MEC4740734.1 hypothetical protein [Shewanella sp. E94]WBJ95307.1 hypothetical protein HWQ47_26560 [Shewanella sp. MTB7]
MKKINWNVMSELGLVEKINREILHPLGLAVAYCPHTGFSESILIADDGIWEYGNIKSVIVSDEEIRTFLEEIVHKESVEESKAIAIEWRDPEPIQKIQLAAFIVEQLIAKIRIENLIVDPTHILKMAVIACEDAETGLPRKN